MWGLLTFAAASLTDQALTIIPTCAAASAQLSPAARESYLARYGRALRLKGVQAEAVDAICAAYEAGVMADPPIKGARKAADGFWYVEKDCHFFGNYIDDSRSS